MFNSALSRLGEMCEGMLRKLASRRRRTKKKSSSRTIKYLKTSGPATVCSHCVRTLCRFSRGTCFVNTIVNRRPLVLAAGIAACVLTTHPRNSLLLNPNWQWQAGTQAPRPAPTDGPRNPRRLALSQETTPFLPTEDSIHQRNVEWGGVLRSGVGTCGVGCDLHDWGQNRRIW